MLGLIGFSPSLPSDMKTLRLPTSPILGLALAAVPAAADSQPHISIAEPQPYTTVVPEFAPFGITPSTTLDLASTNPLVLTIPMPPVAINPGTHLTLRLDPTSWTTTAGITWLKNGEVIAGETDATLVLPAVTAADSGSYQARLTGDDTAATTVLAHLVVRPAPNHPLTNISTRARISPESPEIIVGFVVPERLSNAEYLPKGLLLRAVGPALANLGVPNPLPDPTVQVFTADGQDVTPAYGFATVIYEDGSTPETRYYQRVAEAAATVGAFPVPVPTREIPDVPDYAELAGLPAGAYTLVVRSAAGQSGNVLVEVYQVGL